MSEIPTPNPDDHQTLDTLSMSINPLEQKKDLQDIGGVEKIDLFGVEEQAQVISKIGQWFEQTKDAFPEIGLALNVRRHNDDGSIVKSVSEVSNSLEGAPGFTIPLELAQLFDAILKDSSADPLLKDRDAKFVLERTGSTGTHSEDSGYHLDTKQIYWDEHGKRVGYSPERSMEKYLVFVDRPGTLIIHGKVDPAISQHESIPIGKNYSIDESTGHTLPGKDVDEPVVSQLLPNSIYKVAVGDLLHSPPIHDDGLLITVGFNS